MKNNMKQIVNYNSAEETVMDAFEIFGRSAESVVEALVVEEEAGGGWVKFLELDPAKAADKTDSAIVRLLPNVRRQLTGKDAGKLGKDIVSKISYKVKAGGKIFMFDSNKTNGRYEPCPVADGYWKVKDTKDALKMENFKKAFGYKKPEVTLVQVLKYDANPALVGSIMPLRVYEDVEILINKTLQPSAEDMDLNGTKAVNVFDILTAPALMLKATMKTYGDGGVGRSFGESIFVNAPAYKHFLVPIAPAADAKPDAPIAYEKIQLTEEEVPLYNSKQYTDAIKGKLTKVISVLAAEGAISQQDYAYEAPSEDSIAKVTSIVASILDGTFVPDAPIAETPAPGAEAPATDNTGTATEAPTVNSTASEATATDVDDILRQAEIAGQS